MSVQQDVTANSNKSHSATTKVPCGNWQGSRAKSATAKEMELKIFRTRKKIRETDDKFSAGSRRTRALPSPCPSSTVSSLKRIGAATSCHAVVLAIGTSKSKLLDNPPLLSHARKCSGIPTAAKILSPRLLAPKFSAISPFGEKSTMETAEPFSTRPARKGDGKGLVITAAKHNRREMPSKIGIPVPRTSSSAKMFAGVTKIEPRESSIRPFIKLAERIDEKPSIETLPIKIVDDNANRQDLPQPKARTTSTSQENEQEELQNKKQEEEEEQQQQQQKEQCAVARNVKLAEDDSPKISDRLDYGKSFINDLKNSKLAVASVSRALLAANDSIDDAEIMKRNKNADNKEKIQNKHVTSDALINDNMNVQNDKNFVTTQKTLDEPMTASATPKHAIAVRELPRGTDSHAHVSQTVHIKRKECASETFTLVIRRSAAQWSLPSVYEETIRSEAESVIGGTYDVRDHFVYMTPPIQDKARLEKAEAFFPAPLKRDVFFSMTHIDQDTPPKPARNIITSSALQLSANASAVGERNTLCDHSLSNNLDTHMESALPKFPLNISPILVGDSDNDGSKSSAKAATNSNEKVKTIDTIILHKKASLPADGSMATTSTSGGGAASKLADKLSRSFFDLTQGSHDRLLRWKTKLQQQYGNGSKPHSFHSSDVVKKGTKTSSPKTIVNKKSLCTTRQSASRTSEMEIIVDWAANNHAKSHNDDAGLSSPYSTASSATSPSCASSSNWKHCSAGNSAKNIERRKTFSGSVNNINASKDQNDSNRLRYGIYDMQAETTGKKVNKDDELSTHSYRNCGSLARPQSFHRHGGKSYNVIDPSSIHHLEKPRPLRSSYSATNALAFLNGVDNYNNHSVHNENGFAVLPFSDSNTRRRNSTAITNDLPQNVSSPNHDIFSNSNLSQNMTNNIYESNSLREDGFKFRNSTWDRRQPLSSGIPTVSEIHCDISTINSMEHRTLRQRFNNKSHTTDISDCAMKSMLQDNTKQCAATIFQTWRANEPASGKSLNAENNLPPPARILPYSGIKPRDNAIIRPIAFRPMINNHNQKLAHRQSIGMELASAYYEGSFLQQTNGSTNTLSTSGLQTSGAAEAYEHHRQILRDQSRSIGNLVTASVTSTQQFMSGRRNNTSNLQAAGYSGSSMHLFVSNKQAPVHRTPYQHQSVDTPLPPSTGRCNTQLVRYASAVAAISDENNSYDTVPVDNGRPRIIQECDSTTTINRPDQPYLLAQQKSHHFNNFNNDHKVSQTKPLNGNNNNAINNKGDGVVQKTTELLQKNSHKETSTENEKSVNRQNVTTFSASQSQLRDQGNSNVAIAASTRQAAASAASISSASSRCTNGSPRIGNKFKNGSVDAKANITGADRQTATNGLHITPSPSDSGIVDYETLIRDKEHELSSVRHAMEQNEEVLIRVYHEKERQYYEQIADLRRRCEASADSANVLRQQLAQSEEIRQQLQASVRLLTNDRNSQQQRRQQMEQELGTLKIRCQNLEKLQLAQKSCNEISPPSKCAKCRSKTDSDTPNIDSVYENAAASIVLVERRSSTAARQQSQSASVPTSRCSLKDSIISSSISSSDRELRFEVEDLRGEISNLREQLNKQFKYFTTERQRLKQDKAEEINDTEKLAPAKTVFSDSHNAPTTEFSTSTERHIEKRDSIVLSQDRLI